MSQPVRLTWRTSLGKIVVEDVELMEDDDNVYTYGPDGKAVRLESSEKILEMMQDAGGVIFEDQNGIFSLGVEHIISIEVLGRNKYNAYNENRPKGKRMKDKLKKFWDEHAEDVAWGAMIAGVSVLGFAYMRQSHKYDDARNLLGKIAANAMHNAEGCIMTWDEESKTLNFAELSK